MSTKRTGTPEDRGGADPADPAQIRNVALVGPSGSGKTALVEALLERTGTIARAGSVEAGSTVCDHEPPAVQQQRSIATAVAALQHGDLKINLIDTPGHADFVGDVRAGMRAADAALFVVTAAGVDAATGALWQECESAGVPRAVVIARLDRAHADFDAAVRSCQDSFGTGVLPLYLPRYDESGQPSGVVGVLTGQLRDTAGRATRVEDAEHTAGARDELVEAIISGSEDESLMDAYLAGEEIAEDVLIRDLEAAVELGRMYPVLPVCATSGLGLAELLDGMVRGFPSPLRRHPAQATDLSGQHPRELTADPDAALAAEVVHTSADAYVGRISLVRVFSGTLRPDRQVHVAGRGMADRGHPDHDADERPAHVHSPLGAALTEVGSCAAGDICALTKLGSAETGDTLSDPHDPLLVEAWPMPEPLLPVAVVAHDRSAEDVLARNLNRLTAADPGLRLERDDETHQLVLWCTGQAHAEVVLQRLREGGADVDTEPVRVRMRQTFADSASGHGKHVKQSGGHGQYAVVDIEVEPLPRGAGVEFAERVIGGAVPRQFITSVQKGVLAQAARGITEGIPLVDVRVTLVDGKAHSVDSSDAAFQSAGAAALKTAAVTAGLRTLEPVDEVLVRIPDEHLGAVLGDLSSRRGKVVGTEPQDAGWTVVRAHVPAEQLQRYAVQIRSLSSGSASFTRRFDGYETAPDEPARP